MLEFQASGLDSYDWGGVFEDEAQPGRAGVNRFKEQFGGERVQSYNCIVATSIRGRLYLPLMGSMTKVRPWSQSLSMRASSRSPGGGTGHPK
jgi:hypothetical protein